MANETENKRPSRQALAHEFAGIISKAAREGLIAPKKPTTVKQKFDALKEAVASPAVETPEQARAAAIYRERMKKQGLGVKGRKVR